MPGWCSPPAVIRRGHKTRPSWTHQGTCPALMPPPDCIQGGLSTFAGSWTFTGTITDDNCQASPPTQTMVTQLVTINVDGCNWSTDLISSKRGTRNDTIAVMDWFGPSSFDSGGVSICFRNSALNYASTVTTRCPPGVSGRRVSMVGILTR